jgi:hypothetical protein
MDNKPTTSDEELKMRMSEQKAKLTKMCDEHKRLIGDLETLLNQLRLLPKKVKTKRRGNG